MYGTTAMVESTERTALAIAVNIGDRNDDAGASIVSRLTSNDTCLSATTRRSRATTESIDWPGSVRTLRFAVASVGITLVRMPPSMSVAEMPLRSTAL